MTKQFKYPESAKVELPPIDHDAAVALPEEIRHSGIPLFIKPTERYPPEIIAFLVYGRGRNV